MGFDGLISVRANGHANALTLVITKKKLQQKSRKTYFVTFAVTVVWYESILCKDSL